MEAVKRKNSHTVATVMRVLERINKGNSTKKSRKIKPLFGRMPLLSVEAYYQGEFPNLRFKGEWAKVVCPFHEDHHPSLSINLREGHFKCHACGAKGGGIVKFHAMRYGLPYKVAYTALMEDARHE